MHENKLRILLDLDGVMCDWEKKCAETFGLSYESLLDQWVPGDFDICHILQVDREEMWRRIGEEGEEWWASLEEYPWTRSLYNECISIAPTYFVSSPSKSPSSLAGKLKWIHKFTGDAKFDNYMIGPKKELCANKYHVLVDDNDKNINTFNRNGGKGILFPRINNSGHGYSGDPALYAIVKIREYEMRLA